MKIRYAATRRRKAAAVLLFLLILLLMFGLSFHTLGPLCQKHLAHLLQRGTDLINRQLYLSGASPAIRQLLIQGICAGIGSILSFLPTIAILFSFLYLLKSSGYLDHMSALLDRPLQRFGLSGQSILPMLIGFSCSVPAILAAEDIPQRRQRILTVLLIPFMSCSAKIPVYGAFISVFFPRHRIWMFLALYGFGIGSALLLSRILRDPLYRSVHEPVRSCGDPIRSCGNSICSRGNTVCPSQYPGRSANLSLRLPQLREIFIPVLIQVLGFVKKAFTVILVSSALIWFLENFDFTFHITASPDSSILAGLGKWIAPVFAPAGFEDWRAATALASGLSAKEIIVSTLAVLSGSVPGGNLPNLLSEIFTPLSAVSFMLFCLLYVPCITSLTAIRHVLGKWRYAIAIAIGQILLAWLISSTVYQAGYFFSAGINYLAGWF